MSNSPIVDIIAIGLSNGHIAVFNIKTASVVMEFKQDSSVLAMDFNANIQCPPLLVTSNSIGKLFIWSLNDRKLLNVIEDAHIGTIPFIKFLEADRDELFLSGASEENCIKMWVKDEEASSEFRVFFFEIIVNRSSGDAKVPLRISKRLSFMGPMDCTSLAILGILLQKLLTIR